MRILAIETSCDETAVAIIEASPNRRVFRILSNIVLSQIALHATWGGVVPNLAKREHQKALVPLLLQALKESELFKIPNSKFLIPNKIPNSILEREPELLEQFTRQIVPLLKPPIDLIAVTQGPGLEPALWVGVNFAHALSALWGIPLMGINHMEGHIVSALIEQNRPYTLSIISFPAIALLVSGGHTELVLTRKPLQYKIIGETRDDAAGEAFDKVARILGLGYPGGPKISAEAEKIKSSKFKVQSYKEKFKISLPRPMLHTKDFDFSFSGLKTAVLYLVRNLEKQGVNIKKLRPAICKEFQDAVVEVLVAKTIRAARQYKVKTVLLGGGVTANTQLRKKLLEKIQNEIPDTRYYIPNMDLTGDNALMIAVAASTRAKQAKKTVWKTMKPKATMTLGNE